MCPVFPPFPACGAGKCVNGTCVCTYPFTQNVEFLHRDIAPNEIVFCDSLSFLVIIFSMLVSIMAAMLLVLYAKAIETRKQVNSNLLALVSKEIKAALASVYPC